MDGADVRRRALPPSAGTTKGAPCAWSSELEWNATDWPSGDQRGYPGLAPREVSCTAFSPDTSATQTSGSPLRSEMNVTRRPSGDSSARASRRVDAIATAGDDVGGAPADGVSMRQMLASVNCARRRDVAGRPSRGMPDGRHDPVFTHEGQPLRRPPSPDPDSPEAPFALNRISALSGSTRDCRPADVVGCQGRGSPAAVKILARAAAS